MESKSGTGAAAVFAVVCLIGIGYFATTGDIMIYGSFGIITLLCILFGVDAVALIYSAAS